jgi:CMP-N,N'-diacetyllegionaminic acid synthase
MTKKRFLAVIPARGNSKSMRNKNIVDLSGNPLMFYTLDAAKKAKLLDRIVVSTENWSIKEVALSNGVEVIDRPPELSEDSVNATRPVIHAIQHLQEKENSYYDYVVLLQPNFPFRKAEQIDEAIERMLENIENADSVISVTKQDHPPWWLKQINEDGLLVDFLQYDKSKRTERQHFPSTYALQGCIYIAQSDLLIQKGLFNLLERSLPYVMNEISAMEIEKAEDIEIADFYMKVKGY